MEHMQNNCKCKKCKTSFIFLPEEIKWYEFGTYSAKTVKCTECGCVNVVRYDDAAGLNVNFDERYYK